MYGLFEILFFIMFGLFFVVFIMTLLRGIGQWNRNNHAPRLTVPAAVVAKRRYHHANGTGVSGTSYYVTFQVESGDRMELHLTGAQYGLIVEGDKGSLTFQGTRFLNFERQF